MKKISNEIIIFLLALFCLIISLREFYFMGIVVDEYNTSTTIIYGGYSWTVLSWVKLVFNAILCIIPLINIVKISMSSYKKSSSYSKFN